MKKVLLILFVINCQLFSQVAGYVDDSSEGTSDDPIEISCADDLIYLSQTSDDWSKYFIQIADISFDAEYSNVDWDNDGTVGDDDDASGFTPIGNSSTTFTGSYNGQGHIIDNLYIMRSSASFIGLFGYTSEAVISYIGVTNVNINGYFEVGGLVGEAYSSTISNSFSTGSVNGDDDVGGLVGYTYTSEVTNGYCTTAVTGNYYTGGFVGTNYSTTISNCYCTGAVSGGLYVGELVGSNAGTVSNCFCLESDNLDAIGDGTTEGATEKTDSELQDVATFTDTETDGLTTAWDFVSDPNDDDGTEDYWNIDLDGEVNNGYPILSWQDGGDLTLPIELTSFTGSYAGTEVNLVWETSTEVNNYGFDIERQSVSGGSWVKVGSVEGRGAENVGQSYTFTDSELPSVDTVSYRLKQIDNDATYEYSKTVEVVINNSTVTGIDEEGLPTEFGLSQNYPNPFNPTTTIEYQVPENSTVRIKVYDMLGREVTTLVNEDKTAGYYTASFNAGSLASGIYIYRMEAGDYVAVKKLMLLK